MRNINVYKREKVIEMAAAYRVGKEGSWNDTANCKLL